MTAKNLLVELLVEELPPKALKKLGQSFAAELAGSLVSQGFVLAADLAQIQIFASPRRLGVLVPHVRGKADDREARQKLMPVAVGLAADGKPTPALLKKLSAIGADASVVAQLKRLPDGKAEALFLDSVVPGAPLAEGLQKALEEALAKLPIPKVMSYQLADGWSSVQFVRPAHALVALHGADIVPVSVLGLQAGRATHGHRFEARIDPVRVESADSYAEQLQSDGAVSAVFSGRRAEIVEQLAQAAARAGADLRPVDDDALLDEVTGLVERPNVLIGQFESEFLEVPQECLSLTMKANQKYFPLLDPAGKLSNKFLIVSNIRPADPSAVIQGNERVVRPRLADAKFFFDQDRKKPLASRVAQLAKVVYHGKLGTQAERSERVRAIAHAVVNLLRMATVPYTALARDEYDVLDSKAQEAARLAKTDLLTDMVGEFPELQGIMGGYYARHEGLRDGVAIAIEDHYKPRFAGDALPRNHTGIVVALADKLETLVGLFGVGEKPGGDKDPFALRRHALGVVRLLIESGLEIGLGSLIEAAAGIVGNDLPGADMAAVGSQVRAFMLERLSYQLREQGYTAREVDAVLSVPLDKLKEVPKRLQAVRDFSALAEAEALAAANKRVGNILRKADQPIQPEVMASLLREPAEIALNGALGQVRSVADLAFEAGNYAASLKALAALKTPVDAFFEQVMVNAEDPQLRANRLALLARLHAAMNRVADLSRLAA